MLGTLAAAGVARADDWQICNTNQPPDQVLSACSTVIEQRARNDGDLSRAYLVRGEWYRVRGRTDEALADFEQAEKLDPKSYNAIGSHGLALVQKGQFQEALADYERAITSNPRNP
jgi:tetratricopeptide (TPR) repeat protein